MADKSKIEWTEATWNPVTGCTKISAGCRNCYAERMAKRLRGRAGYPADYPFNVTLHEDRLPQPLHWRKPRAIFVCSMGDLFHKDVPDEFIDKVYGVMLLCPQHTFQVLTKRPERMVGPTASLAGTTHSEQMIERVEPAAFDIIQAHGSRQQQWNANRAANNWRGIINAWPPPNVWHGTTVENQEQADLRIPHLLATPSALRFVSAEPLLGPVDLGGLAPCPRCTPTHYEPTIRHLDWLIIGCESGPKRRPCEGRWVRPLIEQADDADIPVFVKQMDINGKVSKNPEEWPEWAQRRDVPQKGET